MGQPQRHPDLYNHPRAVPFSPPPPFAPDQINQSSPKSSSGFPILAIAILGIITTAFLLVSYYVFVIKCCLNWHRFDVLGRFSNSRAQRRDQMLMVYAPAIENRGLDEPIIRAIPIFQFKRAGEREDGKKRLLECAVCLNEFQEDERLRLLPNCTHAFHIDCIDTWLQTNANCPLCRSNISNTPTDQILIFGPTPTQDDHINLINGGDDILIELSGHLSDQTPATQNTGHSGEVSVPSINTQPSPSPRKIIQRGVFQKKQRKFQHVSSMGDECIDVRGKDDQFSIQPIRRSFSMDSSADRQLYLAVQEILQQNQNHGHELMSSSSSEGCSSRVRRSFFSFGHGRGSRNAVLPVQFEA